MKLQFKDDFTIEHEDNTFSGTFLQLTRNQIKTFDKKYKGKESDESDTIFKERLNLSIMSDDKNAIMALGEEYNYKIIFETILKDIADKKQKN